MFDHVGMEVVVDHGELGEIELGLGLRCGIGHRTFPSPIARIHAPSRVTRPWRRCEPSIAERSPSRGTSRGNGVIPDTTRNRESGDLLIRASEFLSVSPQDDTSGATTPIRHEVCEIAQA